MRGAPPGGLPICASWLQSSVPRRPSRWSSKPMSEPFLHIRHASTASRLHSVHRPRRWRLSPVVQAIQARRGVQCTVAVLLIAARGALTRVDTPRQLMRDLGLTPSEDSSGERRRQGTITTAGHTCARRALIEGAWASRAPAQVSRPLPWRFET
jgi:hypothetical protein